MPTHSLTLFFFFIAAAVALQLQKALVRKKYGRRLPPGPQPLPIIGNILDMPRKHLGHQFAALSSQYGDIVYLEAFGRPIILLGSYEIARELLDKRSTIYSDRMESTMFKMTGLDSILVMRQYGKEWRRDRRAFHQTFNSTVVPRYHAVQLKITRDLLRRVLTAPKDLVEQIKFFFAATTMRVAYGIEITEPHDRYYQMVERIMRVAEETVVPGRYLVDTFPILRHLPSWFPGMKFKRFAAHAKQDITSVIDTLFEVATVDVGVTGDTVIAQLLRDDGSHASDIQVAELEEVCKAVAATVYAAGADTTNATLQAFFLAITMYPEVQAKAQAELDATVGVDRLPDFSDREALPYLNALIKEVQRWHIIGPISVPHRSTVDDEYNGYYIPAGTLIIPNVWAMARDTTRYPDPDKFSPERFLDANGQLDLSTADPTSEFVFGFGRRICPGRHFADAMLFILCASVLHVFDIGPPLDKDGTPKKVEHRMTTDTVISHPEVHEYTIKPRSSQMEHLILDMTRAMVLNDTS